MGIINIVFLLLCVEIHYVFSIICVRPNEKPADISKDGACDNYCHHKRTQCVRPRHNDTKYCACQDSYSRDNTETCVPSDLCKSRRAEKCLLEYEEFRCDSHCYHECIPDTSCPHKCGCFCKDGYKRSKLGKCIKAKDCKKYILKPSGELLKIKWF